MLLAADRVLTPEHVLAPGWVEVDGDRVTGVGSGPPPRTPDHDLGDVTIAPGLVDTHVHGGGGSSFDGGDAAAAATAVETHRRHGTTSMVASLVTDTIDGLAGSAARLADLVDDGLLAGIHLEGPWLSPRYAGAHAEALLTVPTARDVDALVAAGRGHLRTVTLAPELPGALEAVGRLTAAGVVVAVGHTDATHDQVVAALDAGASAGTHLFNAMRPLHHREPGPVGALLAARGAGIELVADGVHVHPAVLALAATAAPERVLLVTDAMAAAGAEDGDFLLGGQRVSVRDGVARRADTGAIAGSTSTLLDSVRYAVLVVGLPLQAAVAAATSRPAALLGLDGAGEIRPGGPADLVVLDHDLGLRRVLHRGVWVR